MLGPEEGTPGSEPWVVETLSRKESRKPSRISASHAQHGPAQKAAQAVVKPSRTLARSPKAMKMPRPWLYKRDSSINVAWRGRVRLV